MFITISSEISKAKNHLQLLRNSNGDGRSIAFALLLDI